MGGMKSLLIALFVALLMVGCGEEAQKEAVQEMAKDDPSVPLAIPCVACGEKVSKKTEECRQCGHPTPDSVVAYKEAMVAYKEAKELERIRAEEIAKRWEEEQRLAAIRAEEEAKAQAKHIGLDDHTIILNAVDWSGWGGNYTGWAKNIHDDGQVRMLIQFKDGKPDGLNTSWYDNGQKEMEGNLKDGKEDGLWTWWNESGQKELEGNYKDAKKDGLWILYNEDGTEESRTTYKDGEIVED